MRLTSFFCSCRGMSQSSQLYRNRRHVSKSSCNPLMQQILDDIIYSHWCSDRASWVLRGLYNLRPLMLWGWMLMRFLQILNHQGRWRHHAAGCLWRFDTLGRLRLIGTRVRQLMQCLKRRPAAWLCVGTSFIIRKQDDIATLPDEPSEPLRLPKCSSWWVGQDPAISWHIAWFVSRPSVLVTRMNRYFLWTMLANASAASSDRRYMAEYQLRKRETDRVHGLRQRATPLKL